MFQDATVTVHLGAPNTAPDQLVVSLRRDEHMLGRHGVFTPRPRLYRKAVLDMASRPRRAPGAEEVFEMTAGDLPPDFRGSVGRVILSSDRFAAERNDIFTREGFFPDAGRRTASIRARFSGNACEFMLCIRNPATFIPALVGSLPESDYETLVGTADLMDIRWSDVVSRICHANPGCPVHVWRHEDAPFVWPGVLRAAGDLDHGQPVAGAQDMTEARLTDEGRKHFAEYIAARPDLTEKQIRRVMEIFLDKFARAEEGLVPALDLPGWSEDTVSVLSRRYEDDLDTLARIPGASLISP